MSCGRTNEIYMPRLALCALVILAFAPIAIADKYDDQAKALLLDLDDKKAPVLPELSKVNRDIRIEVFRNVAAEADDCLAYYYSVSYCVSGTDKNPPPGWDKEAGKDMLQQLKKDEYDMYAVAFAMTEAGELMRGTVKESIHMGIANNAAKIKNDCGNLTVLAARDKTLSCKILGLRPSERLRYWLGLLRK
jgi:hypothetical protein